MTIITDHGKERIKRLGVSKKLAKDISDKAIQFGIKHENTTGSLKKYIDWLYFKEKTANNIRIYNQKVFIFHDEILITVLNLPYRFHSIVEKIKTKQNEMIV